MGLLVARRGSLHPRRAAASGYADEVLADGPLAYWRLEETSGSTVADEIGSNDGTVVGPNLNVSGAPDTGSAADFDGVDDRIEAAAVNLPSRLTIECIVKPDAATGRLVTRSTKGSTSINDTQYQFILISGEVWLAGSAQSGTTARITATTTTLTLGQTYHLAGTWDKDLNSGLGSVYINGVEETVYDQRDACAVDLRNNGQTLLGTVGNSTAWFDGMLDEPALYDKKLSDARILAHAQAAGLA